MVCLVWTDGLSGGRAVYGHVITKFSRMGRLLHFLTHGAPLARFARESFAIIHSSKELLIYQYVLLRQQFHFEYHQLYINFHFCTEDFVLWRFAISRFHWIKEGTGSHYCVNNDQMCQDFVVHLREVALTRARQCYWGNPVFLPKSRA